MMLLELDPSDIYVPFVSSRHSSVRVHEMRRRETRNGGPRRFVGKTLIRAGLAVAGLGNGSDR
jgi:hypothetical protein